VVSLVKPNLVVTRLSLLKFNPFDEKEIKEKAQSSQIDPKFSSKIPYSKIKQNCPQGQFTDSYLMSIPNVS